MGIWGIIKRLFGSGASTPVATSISDNGGVQKPARFISLPPPKHPIRTGHLHVSTETAKNNGSFEITRKWLFSCFRQHKTLTEDEKQIIQNAVNTARLTSRFPNTTYDLTEEHRIEFMKAVMKALGEERFLKLGVIDITRLASRLGIQKKIREPKPISFECSGCGQKYDAPQEMATTSIECEKCKTANRVPRPKSGYYSAITDAQVENAEYLGVVISKDLHHGQASDLLAKGQEAFAQLPKAEQARRYKIKEEKEAARKHQTIIDLRTSIKAKESALKGDILSPDEKSSLRDEVYEMKDELADLVEDEKEDRRINKEIEDRENECDALIRQHYVSEFSSGGDWFDFYRKPKKAQFDDIFAWLEKNGEEVSCSSIAKGIDRLYPELKR